MICYFSLREDNNATYQSRYNMRIQGCVVLHRFSKQFQAYFTVYTTIKCMK